MTTDKTIECPQCGKPSRVDSGNPYRPFCSHRCKLIDLGDWLDESNSIPGPPTNSETERNWNDYTAH